ncbi:MAG TPA: hypothetical protein VI114_00315 [Chthoniobacterales bacterium]
MDKILGQETRPRVKLIVAQLWVDALKCNSIFREPVYLPEDIDYLDWQPHMEFLLDGFGQLLQIFLLSTWEERMPTLGKLAGNSIVEIASLVVRKFSVVVGPFQVLHEKMTQLF